MRIGLFIERPPNTGGGYYQALSMIEALTRPGAVQHEITVFTPYEMTHRQLAAHGIKATRYRRGGLRLIDRWSSTTFGGAILRRLRRMGLRRLGRHLDAVLEDNRIDLVVFSEIGEGALRLGAHSFIVTAWDVFHRDHPEFPEVYSHGNWLPYDAMYRSILPRAFKVIVDSAALARRVCELYDVDPRRIVELPFLPPLATRRQARGEGTVTAAEACQKYQLRYVYVFYPAYFSDHKNHLYLLEGLVDLERRHGIVLDAVFSGGGGPGDQAVVERQAAALGLAGRVHFLGLVPDEDIPALYEAAFALVMPAYSGPTNLPPLEAVVLGCPIVYSDLPEFREQMGEAALYCDLADVGSLADHLAALTRDADLRERLRRAGAARAAEIARIDYGAILKAVFDEFAYLRRRWAWPE